MSKPLKQLGELAALRERLARQAEAERLAQIAQRRQAEQAARRSDEFSLAMLGVTPLAPAGRRAPEAPAALPHPRQREIDDQAALAESISEPIGIETLLDTDDSLSFRRPGIGSDVLRKLRRGDWVLQGQIDLHGHRVDEAHAALSIFVRESFKQGLRCVRVIHGKGLGSKDREPVLKSKVRSWLARRDEVIAFCQARAPDGGAGALLVLLRPSDGAAAAGPRR